jgi:hypothetical protein
MNNKPAARAHGFAIARPMLHYGLALRCSWRRGAATLHADRIATLRVAALREIFCSFAICGLVPSGTAGRGASF